MKRQLSETLCAYSHDFTLVNPLMLKRTKKAKSASTYIKPTAAKKRVRFAEPLEENTVVIPSITSEEEKSKLFYSSLDFARFALNERVRRDALVLTVALTKEQLKRMVRRGSVIPSSSITVMYHKVLSRTEAAMEAIEKKSRNQQTTQQQQQQKQKQQQPAGKIRSRILVARAA